MGLFKRGSSSIHRDTTERQGKREAKQEGFK